MQMHHCTHYIHCNAEFLLKYCLITWSDRSIHPVTLPSNIFLVIVNICTNKSDKVINLFPKTSQVMLGMS